MEKERPYALSIAGLDPSGGAGLLADIKTFEQHRVYGLGVCTAITVQTASDFISVDWLPVSKILAQVKPLLEYHRIRYCKIGIMEDVKAMLEVVSGLKQLAPDIRIVLDPVLKASAGFSFHNDIQQQHWQQLLQQLYLLTPNYPEAQLLTGCNDGEEAARRLSAFCAVLLKGGHHAQQQGIDILYTGNMVHTYGPGRAAVFPKHGSGCVLSSAITASLALGQSIQEACCNGKAYTEKILASHSSLTGYHHQ
ncbi:MAG TPA: hydroxymethylpyrimidine/phosphomethylpyrimidine kinase [Chitinophaga sp.]|uniref:hydroxymethylpyrimidine/phosphomethylpyrimidine kinase n=1 Tax=Chitinophaga sp. TaxID=1869181 RepID=UPI002CD6AC6C|nr:hydroxymethylpyrimidine/phosphomethylpyrimidine kinase [Chitinophaga sp.]HVI46293.1 hydroxymethylpyrimidine/phosphomethylpyrimidine kinase [Chitinophaga sp.]